MFSILFYSANAQITPSINEVFVNSSTTITSCNTIDFGSTSTNNLTFYFKLTRPASLPSGSGTLRIMLKYSSLSSPLIIGSPLNVLDSFWSNTSYESTIACNLSASQVQVSGSSIYLEFETSGNIKTNSCEYPITKTQVPTFTLSPTTQTIPCGSTNPITFTMTNVYSSPGTLTYTWNVGSGWANNSGVPVSGSFTTTTASLVLKPNSYPLSNIVVTPTLDGVNYPQKTCAISLAAFSSTSQISGPSTICNLNSSATYNLITPPVGGTISVIWSSSNSAIATVSGGTSTGVTVNALNVQDNFNLIATITNSCGQTATKTFAIKVGNSIPSYSVINSPGYFDVCGNDFYYLFLDAVSSNNPSGSSYNYSFSGFNTGIANPNVTYVQLTSTRFRFKIPKNKITTGPYPTMTMNITSTSVSCGNTSTIYGSPITLNSSVATYCNSYINPTWRTSNTGNIKDESLLSFTIFPNPSSDVVYIDSNINDLKKDKQSIIIGELYDMMGKLSRKVEIVNDSGVLDVKGLTKGIYLLRIDNNGTFENHKIVVE